METKETEKRAKLGFGWRAPNDRLIIPDKTVFGNDPFEEAMLMYLREFKAMGTELTFNSPKEILERMVMEVRPQNDKGEVFYGWAITLTKEEEKAYVQNNNENPESEINLELNRTTDEFIDKFEKAICMPLAQYVKRVISPHSYFHFYHLLAQAQAGRLEDRAFVNIELDTKMVKWFESKLL